MTQRVTPDTPEAIAQLATEAARGSREALGQLYEMYAQKVWRNIYGKVSDRALADDLSADTWERVIASLSQYDPARGAFSTWLYKVAASVVLNHRRREGSVRHGKELLAHVMSHGRTEVCNAPRPEDLAVEADERRRLATALRALPERQMQSLVLTEFEGLSSADAAAVMGVSVNTFKQARFRATKALRDQGLNFIRNQSDSSRVYKSAGRTSTTQPERL